MTVSPQTSSDIGSEKAGYSRHSRPAARHHLRDLDDSYTALLLLNNYKKYRKLTESALELQTYPSYEPPSSSPLSHDVSFLFTRSTFFNTTQPMATSEVKSHMVTHLCRRAPRESGWSPQWRVMVSCGDDSVVDTRLGTRTDSV
ncbi:hypothetical protein RRG08_032311 [Elysia crispata]|uniref:Uncharacterized protein n=1 Tax=Elysia crispata TaxID=231223 RepID=A0AAE1E346_9GAST|nr:hypothetical protein RRG08_032311 [Elysia crispata]